MHVFKNPAFTLPVCLYMPVSSAQLYVVVNCLYVDKIHTFLLIDLSITYQTYNNILQISEMSISKSKTTRKLLESHIIIPG